MKLRRTTAFAGFAAVVLAACGGAQVLAPRVALREAAKTTAGQAGTTLTLGLVGSEADVNAVTDAAGIAGLAASYVVFILYSVLGNAAGIQRATR